MYSARKNRGENRRRPTRPMAATNPAEKIEQLEADVSRLHDTLQRMVRSPLPRSNGVRTAWAATHARAADGHDRSLARLLPAVHRRAASQGKNSKGTTDIFGRRFAVPVDNEHKATQDPLGTTLFVCSNPHMGAFHKSWFGFFSSFYSTFAAAALNAYIQPDLNLTEFQWGVSNNFAVGGTVFFRLVMGWVCDKFGARRGLAYILLWTVPAIILMMFCQNYWQFWILRCIIGFGLATFVACQTWCAQMFAKQVVGIANATAAGWGNLGGGITNLTMPYVFLLMMGFVNNDESKAWRLSYIVPAILHIAGGLWCLTARDLPDGNFKELESINAKQPSKSSTVLKVGFSNMNAWLFLLTYGMCFGVELTMNSQAAKYFYRYHGLTPQIAGICASAWGLMNLFARSLGGYISDWSSTKAGLRGRLWSCWAVQTLEGIMCIVLGLSTLGLDAPHEDSVGGDVMDAWTNLGDDPLRRAVGLPNGWVNLNQKCASQTGVKLTIKACDTLNAKLDQGLIDCLGLANGTVNILRQTAPPESGGPALSCISNADMVGVVMVLVILFSLCVQAAEGLHYGIVPYISRPALGVVSGMVGAGGNLGAVISGQIFFTGAYRTDQGILNLGIMIMCITLLIGLMYFPEHGSMFFKAGALKYDPQLIKPPAEYRGADVMDYDAAKKALDAKNAAAASSTTTAEVTVSKA